MPESTGIRFGSDNAKTRRCEEILSDRAPKVPNGLQSGHFFLCNKGLGIDLQELSEHSQEFGGAVETNRRLQVGFIERLTELPTKLTIHANVDCRVVELGNVVKMAAKREDEIDLDADSGEKSLNLGKIRPRVEVTVGGANNIDLLCGGFFGFLFGFFLLSRTVLLPKPDECSIGALPLIFVNSSG